MRRPCAHCVRVPLARVVAVTLRQLRWRGGRLLVALFFQPLRERGVPARRAVFFRLLPLICVLLRDLCARLLRAPVAPVRLSCAGRPLSPARRLFREYQSRLRMTALLLRAGGDQSRSKTLRRAPSLTCRLRRRAAGCDAGPSLSSTRRLSRAAPSGS